MSQPLVVRLDNAVRVPLATLPAEVAEALRGSCEHTNPKRDAMRRMGIPGWWAEKAVEKTWTERRMRTGSWLNLPRGALQRMKDVVAEAGIAFEIDDCRTEGAADMHGALPAHKRTLRDFQHEAIPRAVVAQQGIIRAPTGSGKTVLAFALAARLNLPTLVLVNSRELLDQWVDRAQSEFGLSPKQVGIIQGSKRVIKPLTVAMQQSLHKQGVDEELANAFGLLVYDEVQLASASSYFEVVSQFPAKYRVGVSADNRRKDGKEYLNEDLFGGVIYEISRAQLEDEGVVLDVEVRCIPTDFEAPWYGTGADEEIDFTRLNAEMGADEGRNAILAAVVVGEARAGERVFVMARQREHAQRLAQAVIARGVNAGFLIGGEDYRAEFRATKEAMLKGALRVGVGTVQAIGTGIDFPAVGRAAVATPIAGNKQLLNQVRGRVCRTAEGKSDAVLYYLLDVRCSFGKSHLRNLISWNRRVVVREGDRWIPGGEYLRRMG